MNDDRFYFLLTEYLDSQLDEGLELELKAELVSRGENVDDLENLRRMSVSMDRWKIPQPSERLKDNFYTLLAAEQQKQENLVSVNWWQVLSEKFAFGVWMPRLAYGLTFLLLGYFAGITFSPSASQNEQIAALSVEVDQMREMMMLTLLNDPTASERLKAISTSHYIAEPDDKIIRALLKTLNSDPNENVRLAAVDALLMFSGIKEVREGLIGSINHQHSPMIQIALTDGMLALNEKEATPALQRLLQRKNLNPLVKTRVEQTIQKLI